MRNVVTDSVTPRNPTKLSYRLACFSACEDSVHRLSYSDVNKMAISGQCFN